MFLEFIVWFICLLVAIGLVVLAGIIALWIMDVAEQGYYKIVKFIKHKNA